MVSYSTIGLSYSTMARPKIKGDRIQIYLPLDTDAAIRSRAKHEGVPVPRLVENLISQLFAGTAPRLRPPNDCRHPNAKISGYGIGLCPDCGWKRDAKMQWHP